MSQSKPLWYLENIDVTGIFCPKKVGAGALDHHVHRHFKRGEYIFLPEEHADRLYFVFEGRVKIGTYSEDGKEITKTILGPGEVFGELALIGADKRRDFAYAMEPTVTCVLTMEEVHTLMREYTGFSLFLMRIMGGRVLDMERRLESLVFKDSRTRIVEFLLNLAREKGQRVGYEWVVRKFLTHQEIANLTATSRQTVTTTLNELRNKDILTFNRKRLLIRDLEQLAAEMGKTSTV
ncbi:MAG: Crp/Fnr family transcriptional regulator [Lewinella sp.]|nr:Crp/Fnr family transcriptional regulator [Lewinella sp.]